MKPTISAEQPYRAPRMRVKKAEADPHGRHHNLPYEVSGCCSRGNHYGCMSRNCTCKCGHRGGR
jgi:hypothetical protein